MDTVQALRGDPDSSEAEHARIMLVQTEVERVKFVVRSYIRTRFYKARIPPLVSPPPSGL
jgi:GINS complex subunit 4